MSDSVDTFVRPGDEPEWEQLKEFLDQSMAFSNQANWHEAVVVCRDAIKAFPQNPEPYFLLAVVAFYLGDEGQSIKMAETAHEMDPDTREYADVLATVSARVGRLTDGIYYAKIAETCEPHPYLSTVLPAEFTDLKRAFEQASPSHHNIEGQRFFNETKFESALKEFKAEISLNPDNVEALIFLARTTIALGRYGQALGVAQSAIHYEPENAMARALLARALVCLGRDSEATFVAKEAIRLSEGDADVYQTAMYALQQSAVADIDELKNIAQEFEKVFVEENEVEDPEVERVDGQPSRIGMLSNAFYAVPHMDYVAGWFALPPGANAQIRGLQYSIIRDAVTTLCKNGATEWREIYGIDPFTLDMTLRGEQLDVLVDISRVDGETCAAVPGLRPTTKRVGVTALPEPGMMPGITHVLSDETLAPADRTALLPGQELLTMSGTLFARLPYKTLPQDSAPPMVRSGAPTFGARASFPEMSPQSSAMMSRVLLATPNSQLYLFGGAEITDQARARIREQFMNTGVIDRVFFVEDEDTDELTDKLQKLEVSVSGSQWAEVDVFLDTFPLNGRREIYEALWSGVPVVTRRGLRRASSVGASILSAAGHPEWIAKSDDDYVDAAVDLVKDVEVLSKTRASLQESISGSLVFNPAHAAKEVRRLFIDLAAQN